MARRRYELSARGRRAERSARPIPDKDIDFSDIPQSSDEELGRAKRVGRPRKADAKRVIALRIRPSLLAIIRRTAREEGRPYQTFIHEILEKEMKRLSG